MTTQIKTQIVSLEHFASLFQDMLSITQSHGRHLSTIGVHPEHGRISFVQLDDRTGDGLLTVLDPHARYERKPGELTCRERDEWDERWRKRVMRVRAFLERVRRHEMDEAGA